MASHALFGDSCYASGDRNISTSSGKASVRVALMLDSAAPGGAERMLLELAMELRNRGHDVTPVGPRIEPNWLRDGFIDLGFRPDLYERRGSLDPRWVTDLVRIFRRKRIEVVHSHESTMAFYGTLAALLARTPHVVTLHGGIPAVTDTGRRRKALRWALHHSRPVTVSHAARQQLTDVLGLHEAAVDVIHNGIRFTTGAGAAVRSELNLAKDEPLILAVGNLYPVKGHMHLLEAAALLRRRRPELPWRLAIAGKVTLLGNIQEEGREFLEFASAHGFRDRFHLLGFRSDVPDLLDAADVYAMPSLSEGLPLSLLEAMFASKPIVASRVGGIPEVITSGGEGYLTEPGDAESIFRALEKLLADRAARERLGQRARKRAEEGFRAEAMATAYERVYGSPSPVLDLKIQPSAPSYN